MEEYPGITCLHCRVVFTTVEAGREHYKSEWHRYNLKRKIADLPPISSDLFKSEVIANHAAETDKKRRQDIYCSVCNKVFRSKNAYDSHLHSKIHLMFLDKQLSKTKCCETSELTSQNNDEEDIAQSDDSDVESWNDEDFGLEECLFCSFLSQSLDSNLRHMTLKHGFHLPDVEFISDVEQFITHLGNMISIDHLCLWCHPDDVDHVSRFQATRDVQKHMVDKGHCKVRFDHTTQHYFVDFYDYSSSYPDADEVGCNSKVPDLETLDTNGFELALPSGAIIGHRSLHRFYRQNLLGKHHIGQGKKAIYNVVASYKAVGWTGSSAIDVKKRAKDIHYFKRIRDKYHLKLQTKANKMQSTYREQNPI